MCLGASISFKLGVKLRKAADNYNQEQTINNSGETSTVEDKEYTTTTEVLDITENIIDLVKTINFVKPLVTPNYMESFISTELQDELSKTYLKSISYQLPKNKRTKKGYIRHKDLGILQEHYPVLKATGYLH